MKNCIVTRADNNIKEMTDITHPVIKRYAKRCEADFIVLDDPQGLHPHYRILQAYGLFKTYNNVLSLDSDILVLPDCPNLFKTVQKGLIGTVLEDKGSRQADRRARILKVQSQWGDIKWRHGYPNSGVMLIPKECKEILKPRGQLWMDNGYDDVYLGYWITKLGYGVQELSYKFNHMRMFSEEWNGSPDRLKSHIIHYAGGGSDKSSQLQEIKRDYDLLYKDADTSSSVEE